MLPLHAAVLKKPPCSECPAGLVPLCTRSGRELESKPTCSGALKEISSRMRSRMVCSLRAPMLSTRVLTSSATSEIRRMAGSVKMRSTPSVAMSACCCRIMLCSGSVKILKKSFALQKHLCEQRSLLMRVSQDCWELRGSGR